MLRLQIDIKVDRKLDDVDDDDIDDMIVGYNLYTTYSLKNGDQMIYNERKKDDAQ